MPPSAKWPQLCGTYIDPAIEDKVVMSRQEARGDRIIAHHKGNMKLRLQNKLPVRRDDVMKPAEGRHKCILIEGAPGVGKSTFVWKLCREWGDKRILQEYKLLVLLRLQDRRIQAVEDLADIFYHPHKRLRDNILEEVIKCEGKGMMIIVDGIDEFPHLFHKPVFHDLIEGVSLPEASIVLTTRPSGSWTVFGCLQPETMISQYIEILGFLPEDIERYCKQAFQSEQQLRHFEHYLSVNPHVKGMMYIPLNCAVVIEVYKQSRRTHSAAPHTITELYTNLCYTILHRYMSERRLRRHGLSNFSDLPPEVYKDFIEVCRKAFEMSVNPQDPSFSPDNPDCDFNHLGFMQSFTEVGLHIASVSYCFLHSTIQEYLAAVYISTLPVSKQKELQKTHHKDCHFENVWRFFAGQTKFRSIGWQTVKEICFVVEDKYDLEEKDEETSTGVSQSSSILNISTHGLQWLYESQDDENFQILDSTYTRFRSISNMTPFDCLALGTCIARSHCKWELMLTGDQIGEAEIRMLVSAMGTCETETGGIDKLDLCIGQNAVQLLSALPDKHLVHITEMHLRRSNLNSTLTLSLASTLRQMTNLVKLNLSYNPLRNGGSEAIVLTLTELNSLRKLYLKDTEIGILDVKAICTLLKSQNTRLETLDLSENSLSPDCITRLSQALQLNNSLRKINLSFSKFDHESMISFATMLQRNDKLDVLKLKNCDIDNVSASFLATALSSSRDVRVHLDGNMCTQSLKEKLKRD